MEGEGSDHSFIQQNEIESDLKYVAEKDVETYCRTLEDLMGTERDFGEIGLKEESFTFGEELLATRKFEEKLQEVQTVLFESPTFIEEKKAEVQRARGELEKKKLQQKALEEEIKKREAETKASAFQFDFGYLDAEVHDLLQQLENVYPNVVPMPNTTTTKSIYSSTKTNVEKLGLKVIMNRICLLGKYNIPGKSEMSSGDYAEEDKEEDVSEAPIEDVQKKFIEGLRRIRSRADSVFSKELGEMTGCLLSYPNYFIVMFEGPELSIMDVLHQGKSLLLECVDVGSVLFIAANVMVRYLHDWTDLTMNPPNSGKTFKTDSDNVEAAKEMLGAFSEMCQTLWRVVCNAKSSGLNPADCVSYDMLPEERMIQFCIDSGLLRPLDQWLRRATELTFGDFTSESWPQIYYPSVVTAHKSDTQFDSLGVLDQFEDVPWLDAELEHFLKNKISWKARDSLVEDLDSVLKSLKAKMVKQGSITSILSVISKDTAYH